MGVEDRRKWGRPGSIHHASGRKVYARGGAIFKYMCTKLESEFFFYQSRRVVSMTLRSGAQKHSGALEWMVLCVVLAVGPLPPTSTSRPPDVIHMMTVPRPFLF